MPEYIKLVTRSRIFLDTAKNVPKTGHREDWFYNMEQWAELVQLQLEALDLHTLSVSTKEHEPW